MKKSELKNIIKEELKNLKENKPQQLNEGWVYYCDCPNESMGIICTRPCDGCSQGCSPLGPGEVGMAVGPDGRLTPGKKTLNNPVRNR